MTKEEVIQKLEFELKWLSDAGYNTYNVDIAFDSIRAIIDKYKAESEGINNDTTM